MSNVYSPSLRATLVGARKMGLRPSNVYSPYNVLIIGGGLGGLFTAALLSKSGMRCLVLEKNAIIGGGLQSFRRGTFRHRNAPLGWLWQRANLAKTL